MGIDVDNSSCESEDDARRDEPKPGQYHVRITGFNDTFEKVDKIIVTMEVLAGTVPGQESKEHTEFFPTTDAAMPRLNLLGMVTGVVPPGQRGTLDEANMVGRQLVIVLEQRERDGKSYTNITWDGMYSLTNPAVATVPKAEGLPEWTDPKPQAPSQPQPPTAPPAPMPPTQAPPAASGVDPYGDL